ncbi:telomerase Cajal body protein 1-like [Diadema setosum]|uniref:telomerase Cajal body protein 1-like n=1 Tax=Diadema setosum TaxID=31175 RepID=UPI003B3A9ED4
MEGSGEETGKPSDTIGQTVASDVADARADQSAVVGISSECLSSRRGQECDAMQTASGQETAQASNDSSTMPRKGGDDGEGVAGDIAVATEREICDDDAGRMQEDGGDPDTASMDIESSVPGCDFTQEPVQIAKASAEYMHMSGNFLKGCKWSPDGLCIVTNSDDHTLRFFNLPPELCGGSREKDEGSGPPEDIWSVLQISEGELIYDYAWYPQMNSYYPETCCLVSSCRDHPVHLWDAFSGSLRGTYKPINTVDELSTPHSLCFSRNGKRLFCGFNKQIRIFRTDRPGRDCEVIPTKGKGAAGQSGIISCFAMAPELNLFAAGSYSKSVGLYSADNSKLMCLLEGHSGGVTHLQFSPDRTKLYSGGRKDNEILCWDVRNTGHVLFSALREVSTHQRIYFDLDGEGHYLVSGNQNGTVTVWDTTQTPMTSPSVNSDPLLLPTMKFKAHQDCVNGVSLHPYLPVMATASGQRRLQRPWTDRLEDGDSDDSSSGGEEVSKTSADNSLRLWSLHSRGVAR